MAKYPLANYYAAVSSALRAEGTIEAIPSLLILMAADGYGHEAEDLRRLLTLAADLREVSAEELQSLARFHSTPCTNQSMAGRWVSEP